MRHFIMESIILTTDLTFFTNESGTTLADRSAESLFENFYDHQI